jgi:hypothetical protein
MFDWFKPKMAPEGPVTFDFETEIEAPASEIYALVDFADPRNAKRQMGHSVERGEGSRDTFVLIMKQMPDAEFVLSVTDATAPLNYGYRCDPRPQQGRLQWSAERYTIEDRGDGKCLVTLLVEAQFDEPMPQDEYAQHVGMMAAGCDMALEKLKLQAERGLEAVLEYERTQFG